MTHLTAPQLALLTDAAAALDGAIDAANSKTVAALIKRGFLISVPRTDGPSRLLITALGRVALPTDLGASGGRVGAVPHVCSLAAEDEPSGTTELKPKPNGKIASLVELLRQPSGTTVAAMMAATGWQAHSVRGALSGAVKKKLGLTVLSEKVGDARVYRIVAGARA